MPSTIRVERRVYLNWREGKGASSMRSFKGGKTSIVKRRTATKRTMRPFRKGIFSCNEFMKGFPW